MPSLGTVSRTKPPKMFSTFSLGFVFSAMDSFDLRVCRDKLSFATSETPDSGRRTTSSLWMPGSTAGALSGFGEASIFEPGPSIAATTVCNSEDSFAQSSAVAGEWMWSSCANTIMGTSSSHDVTSTGLMGYFLLKRFPDSFQSDVHRETLSSILSALHSALLL